MRHSLHLSWSMAVLMTAMTSFSVSAVGFDKHLNRITGDNGDFVEIYRPQPSGNASTMLKAPGEMQPVNITVIPTDESCNLGQLCLATEIDGQVYWQNAEQVGENAFTMSVPEGEYEAMAFFYLGSTKSAAMICKSITVGSGENQIEMNAAEATIRTDLIPLGPDGEVLGELEFDSNNIIKYDTYSFVDYKGSTLVMLDFGRSVRYYLTNSSSSDYNLTSVLFLGCRDDIGAIYQILPVDFSKSTLSATGSDWQSASVEFQPTPFNALALEVYGSELTISLANFMAEGKWYFSSGRGFSSGFDDNICNCGKVSIWAPEGYNGFINVAACPIGSAVSGNDSAIQGMGLIRTENGLTQLGQNLYFGRAVFDNPFNTDLCVGGNELYKFNPDGMKFGNCAPSFINYQASWTMFDYGFTGRHGENLSIDTFSLYDITSDIEQYGSKCTSSMLITCNGRTVCDNRLNFDPENDYPEGKYHVEVSTDNVLVDGVTAGYSKAVFEYETDEIGQAPTLAGLQFRNNDDKITDRFATSAEGKVILYATQFFADYDEDADMMWYKTISTQGITVEAAPYTTEDYVEIPVTTDPAKDYELGWGQYFEGSLAGITDRSANGWYKIRVTIQGLNGSWEQQTICPAFYVQNLDNGVKDVCAEKSPLNFRVEGRDIITAGACIYDLNGIETDGHNLTPGLYIISDGTRTAKAFVK